MRLCLPELLDFLSDQGEINLSLKLKNLTDTSYFAVHYGFLTQKLLPSYSPDKVEYSSSDSRANLQLPPPTSFLVYYQINPTLQRAYVIGILPLKVDMDNRNFWLSNQ